MPRYRRVDDTSVIVATAQWQWQWSSGPGTRNGEEKRCDRLAKERVYIALCIWWPDRIVWWGGDSEATPKRRERERAKSQFLLVGGGLR